MSEDFTNKYISIQKVDDCCEFFMDDEGDIEIVQGNDVLLVKSYQIKMLAASLNVLLIDSEEIIDVNEDLIKARQQERIKMVK